MLHLHNQRVTEPCAFVTKGRQRIKQFGVSGNLPTFGTVYLNNGDEFEIELFNPTTNKVLAEILVNGKVIGTSRGIVLRPGERVFLERFLNDSRKFRFETYEVDASDPNTQRAIAENGKVEVKFYQEYVPLYYWGYTGYPTITTWPPSTSPGYYWCSSTVGNSVSYGGGGTKSASLGSTDNTATYTASCNFVSPGIGTKERDLSGQGFLELNQDLSSMETGRVEKGSHSNQSFGYDDTSFNTYYSWRSEWKILPASQKPLETRELNVFCPSCGMKRRKSSHNFCPKCGQKY